MDDADPENESEPAKWVPRRRCDAPAHVWGVWKRQPIEVGGDSPQERERRARAILAEHHGLIGMFLARAPLPQNSVFDTDDLVRVYQVVLLQAHSCYDPTKATFATWAMRWLRQAFIDINRRARGLSRREQTLYLKQRARERWERDIIGARPTDRQEPPQLSSKESDELVRMNARRLLSMQAASPVHGVPLEDHLADDTSDEGDIEDLVHSRAQREWLYKKLSNGVLSPRERQIMRFELEGRPTKEVAEHFQVKRQYIEALRKAAIRKLQAAAIKDGLVEE